MGEASLRRVQVSRPGAGKRLLDPETGAVRETLLPLIHGVEVIHYYLPGRQTTGTFHAHRPGTVELFVVMAGQLVVQAGEEQVSLAAGDVAALAADVAHSLSNPGGAPCTFVLFIVPPA
ncbi:MAG: cupin domain-containing protein [Limnochordaceae bacterium]|nr:cupin domain-containing protein [Limnochordaceae bacterium]